MSATYTDECTLCGHVSSANHISALMTMTGIHGFMHSVGMVTR